MKLILILIPYLLLGTVHAEDKFFPDERSYVHHLFPNAKACKEAQNGHMWFNCSQQITFRKDGTASAIFTDIMNPATYRIEGSKIILTALGSGDMPTTLVLIRDSNQRNLVNEGGATVWELEQPCEK